MITASQALTTPAEELCWTAVLNRDRAFDGSFVFAVRSTRIFCRPSCPARRPGREQVLFFPRPEAAQQSGFRPCRRCHPEGETPSNPQLAMVEQACRLIEANLDRQLTLDELADKLGFSPQHMQRIFKRATGVSPREYADARRADAVKADLRMGKPVTTAIYGAGYGSSSRVYDQVTTHWGMTPRTYRQGGKGMEIRWTIVDAPLGRLLVAATEHGVCAVSLGDDAAALEAALRAEYPAATLRPAGGELAEYVDAMVAHLKGQQPSLDLPLDIQATAFQRLVWNELQHIPYGETRTYGQVARAIGQPSAARAVARACATNPVALVVPCHRVVREDGGLGGYRWQIERKQALLTNEATGNTSNPVEEPR